MLEDPLHDPVLLAEIGLLAEVMIAATRAHGMLPAHVLDEVLGVTPRLRTA